MFARANDGESTILDALEGYPDDVSALSLNRLEESYAELHRIRAAVEAKRMRYLAALERAGVHRRDGYVSAAAWVADRFGEAAGAAKREVKVAVALEEAPAVRQALASGELPGSSLRILLDARQEHPEAFVRDERTLVEEAVGRPADELRRLVAEWSLEVDALGPADRLQRLRERRRLSVCPTALGMVRIAGELDPGTGEPVVTALRAIVDAGLRVRGGPVDERTPEQRYADALGLLSERFLRDGDRPMVGGERPNVTVTVGLEALRSAEGSCEMDHAGSVPVSLAQALACDASITRVVLSPRSEPLDVGRRTPVVPSAIRRALIARDHGCRFPSCNRPHPWTDAHHVVHWADGGVTAIENLVLLCREHHRAIHDDGFSVRIGPEGPTFTRPDGSRLQNRRGPLRNHRGPPAA
jgi:hypothetical protein